MSVYYIISYDIHDMDTFQQYPALALPLINEYGGEVLVVDTEAVAIEGQAKQMNALVVFPSQENALGCYNDPRYQEVMKIRTSTTLNGSLILAKGITNE